MDGDFWRRVWLEGRTGFHEGKPNRYLERYAPRWPAGRRVLVPLCGKSEDLAHLASLGHHVVGVELAEPAARAFFDEHALAADETRHGAFVRLQAAGVEIWMGDFFDVTAELLGPLDALYDRAALVALPPSMRPRYVEHVRSLLSPAAQGLLVSFEYDDRSFAGPPFSVEEAEVRAAWGSFGVEDLETAEADLPRLREAGVRPRERCYWLGRS